MTKGPHRMEGVEMSREIVRENQVPYLSEEDILRGMEALRGYVDLTPQDFRELFAKVHAFSHERFLREYTAANIMIKPVFSIWEDSSVGDCIGILAERKISGAPVVDDSGILVGVISEKDILRLLGKGPETHLMQLIYDSIRQPLHPSSSVLLARVGEIMSAPAVTALPETNLAYLAHIFGEHAINRLPIADKTGKVLGIITRSNMIRAISGLV